MAMFIPRQQLNDMVQAQAVQTLSNSTDPTARLIALNTLTNTQPQGPSNMLQPVQQVDSWSFFDEMF